MRARARLCLRLPDAGTARTLEAALRPENRGYVAMRVEGREVTAEAQADALAGLRRTLDDLLSAVSVALGASAAGSGPEAGDEGF